MENIKKLIGEEKTQTLECISSYMVDIFYNSIYEQCLSKSADKKIDSVRVSYIALLNTFLKSFSCRKKENNGFIAEVSAKLHDFVTAKISKSKSSSTLIREALIPEDVLSNLDSAGQTRFIRIVLTQAVEEFGKYCAAEINKIIIRENRTSENTEVFLDIMVDILYSERTMLQAKMTGSTVAAPAKSTAPAPRLQGEIKNLIQAKDKIIADLQNKVKMLMEQLIIREKELKELAARPVFVEQQPVIEPIVTVSDSPWVEDDE